MQTMRHVLLGTSLIAMLSLTNAHAALNCIAERTALAKATRYQFDPGAVRDTPADTDPDTVEVRTDRQLTNPVGEVAASGQIVYLPPSDGKTSAAEQRARSELLLRALDARMQARHGKRCPSLFGSR
ncbi:hypothetical protein [Ahniella affigens]|uniref:hypothetical protein n=1 Tax=Ahniella affigens TaxID=2021234 RepID=UPI0011B1D42E|nr:hypothetical protein [Ahniella affigens]